MFRCDGKGDLDSEVLLQPSIKNKGIRFGSSLDDVFVDRHDYLVHGSGQKAGFLFHLWNVR